MTRNVFICYRTADTATITGRMRDRLVARYGESAVTKDVMSFEGGAELHGEIREAIQNADIVLVVIGPRWDPARLVEADDWVRTEIEIALQSGKQIIPLLHNVDMPQADVLPESIRAMATRIALPLRDDPDFDHDVTRLLKRLEPAQPPAAAPTRAPSVLGPSILIAAVAAGLLIWRFGGTWVMPPEAAARLRQRFAAPFCERRNGGELARCAFATYDACARVAGPERCVVRPAAIACDRIASVEPAAGDRAACYPADACVGACVRVNLDPVVQAAPPTAPPTDDELRRVEEGNPGPMCLYSVTHQRYLSCSYPSEHKCELARASSDENEAVCVTRPDELTCAPGALVSSAGREFDCFQDDQTCRQHAFPGAICHRVRSASSKLYQASCPSEGRLATGLTLEACQQLANEHNRLTHHDADCFRM